MKKGIRICRRCGYAVFKSSISEYSWQCFNENEDLYDHETNVIDKTDYLTFIVKETGCGKEEAEELCDCYEQYVKECITDGIKDRYPVCMNEYYDHEYQNDKQTLSQL